ncbi:MAG TPA: hypothetical protein VE993_20700, partial [Stellaceae bacterium]|nr:hypothetical protein [Stellaceae bacterium]
MREHVSKLIGEAEEIRPHANGDARPGGGAADKKAANWEAERKELATKVADLALTRLTDEAKYLFELRAQMARTGLTKRELAGLVKPVYEKLKAKQDQELGGEAPPAQRDEVEAIGRSCELFRDADGAGYASVQREGHCETWSISSDRFRRYLLGEYRRRHGRLAAGTALSDGIEGIAALAAEGPIREVFVRVADAGGRIYLDLGRDDWKIVEIDGQGWRILDTSPVPFLRPAGMRPLPLPCRDALGIARLRPLVNIPSDKDWILYVSFLIGCFLPKGPYPILIVNGEQGSAKTWTIKVTRRLLDPAKIDAAKPPRSEEDLLIVALHYRLLCYDNFSSIGDWLADAFCRLSSGAGEQKRTLHTNTDLTEINAWRPLALNGIPDLTSRGDFADRTIVLVQPRIPDERRRQEEELDQELISSAPTILGGLLDGV